MCLYFISSNEYKNQIQTLATEQPTSAVQSTPAKKKAMSETEKAELDQRIKERIQKRKLKNKIENIEVYVTSWCPHCRNLENFLKKANIPYKRYDIDKDKEAKKRHAKLSKTGGIPTTKIGDHVIQGNNQKAILQYLMKK